MTLESAARRRYARHVLLSEISDAGQETLLAACFRRGDEADENAYAVAAEYLGRAGCRPNERGDEVRVADTDAVLRFAGSPELAEPAAAVVGAFAAVEHLKAVLGVGTRRDFPSDLSLSTES